MIGVSALVGMAVFLGLHRAHDEPGAHGGDECRREPCAAQSRSHDAHRTL
jgi:hypothetical protein